MTKPIFSYVPYRGRKNLNVSNYYYREGDERLYKRIWGGLAPPSEKPGAIVVVGEELALRPPAHIYFVDEAQESALDNLLQRALDFRGLYQVQEFYSCTKDNDYLRYLSHWNAGRREKHLKTVEISTAPNSSSDGNISFHISLLRSRLAPNEKTLHLGESKLLPAAFNELSMSEVAKATDSQHPLLAALGYVVSALDSYANWDRDEPEFAQTEYDIDSIMDR